MVTTIKIDKTRSLKHSDAFLQLCEQARGQVNEVTVDELKDKLQSNSNSVSLLIDTRDWFELEEQGYIQGAAHLSKGWLEADIHYLVSDKQTEIVLYCGGGKRSLLAAVQLQKMGYSNVHSLKGGFKAWKACQPVEQVIK